MGSTNGSYSKVYLVVSDTEPENPTDGLLWYNPDLCTTTTSTTIFGEGPLCVTVMTVGEVESISGYINGEVGSINPSCNNIINLIYVDNALIFTSNQFYCDEITVVIDDNVYILLITEVGDGEFIYLLFLEQTPFPEVGETCNVKICGSICTTTTTTIQE